MESTTNITARFTRRRNPAQYEHADAEIVINGSPADGETDMDAAARLMMIAKSTVLGALGMGAAPTTPARAVAPPASEPEKPVPAEDPKAKALSDRGFGTVVECKAALDQCGGDAKKAAAFLRGAGDSGGSSVAGVGPSTVDVGTSGADMSSVADPIPHSQARKAAEPEVIPPSKGAGPSAVTDMEDTQDFEPATDGRTLDAAEPPDGTVITGEELRRVASNIAMALGAGVGGPFVNEVMRTMFGVERLSLIPEDQRPAFIRALKKGPSKG
jgi:hypothetical protein